MYSYDDCYDPGAAGGAPRYAIMGFVLANDCRRWATVSRETRRDAIAAQYAAMFGAAAAPPVPTAYHELDWSAEEFSAGCYVGVMPPQVRAGWLPRYDGIKPLDLPTPTHAPPTHAAAAQFMTHYFGLMREPMGGVHFAGTETGYEWSGYIDGAIRAGDRAANEVIKALVAGGGVPHIINRPLPTYAPSAKVVARPIGPSAAEKALPSARQAVWGALGVVVTVAAAAVAAAAWLRLKRGR